MTDWDDGDPGDIDTHADAAYEQADQERKRQRENRPVASEQCAYCTGHGDVWTSWGGLVTCGHCHGTGIAQPNERAADAENTNQRGDT